MVCELLAAPVILGCDFCDRFFEAIFEESPRKRLIEMGDTTTVPINRHSLRHPYKQVRMDLEEDEAEKLPLGARVSPKLRVAKNFVLSPETHTWVTVTTKRHGLAVIRHNDNLYHRESISATNGIAQVEPDKPFRVLVANFGRIPRSLAKKQVNGTPLPHATAILQTRMSLADFVAWANDAEDETHRANISGVSEVEPSKNKEGVDVQELDLSHVAFCHREKPRTMLRKYSHMWNGSLGQITTTEHTIDLVPGPRRVSLVLFRAVSKALQAEQDEVDRMLRAGVIEPAQSEWAPPVVLVPKPDGSFRFCVDYRRMDTIPLRDTYPLPRMDECIQSLEYAPVFTTLDCNSGYWKIPVAPLDRDMTTFTCHAGTYRYRHIQFGLTNAPATYQRTLDILLSSFTWKNCLVYLDDVIIFSKDME